MEVPLMKTKMTCEVLLIMTLALGSTALGVEMPTTINSQKDLNTALQAAKTPEDHARIAAYYRTQAESQDSQAASYEKSAATYRNGPVVKNLMAPNTAARYEAIAKGYRDEAQSDRQLAASQDQLARNTEVASK
jgi:hypothetical protein